MSDLLLEGNTVLGSGADTGDLHATISRLEDELRREKIKRRDAEHRAESSVAAITELRNQLGGLYRALRAVFGEIELAIGETPEPVHQAGGGSPSLGQPERKMTASWMNWINKLGGPRGAFIQAILDHGPSSAVQIKVAMGTTRQQTVYDAASALQKMGLVIKRGNLYDLKE